MWRTLLESNISQYVGAQVYPCWKRGRKKNENSSSDLFLEVGKKNFIQTMKNKIMVLRNSFKEILFDVYKAEVFIQAILKIIPILSENKINFIVIFGLSLLPEKTREQ